MAVEMNPIEWVNWGQIRAMPYQRQVSYLGQLLAGACRQQYII